jgi:hypothetical protein
MLWMNKVQCFTKHVFFLVFRSGEGEVKGQRSEESKTDGAALRCPVCSVSFMTSAAHSEHLR